MVIIGYQEPGSNEWKAKPLTRDHKPENVEEMQRIKRCGGKVVSKSGRLNNKLILRLNHYLVNGIKISPLNK